MVMVMVVMIMIMVMIVPFAGRMRRIMVMIVMRMIMPVIVIVMPCVYCVGYVSEATVLSAFRVAPPTG